MPQPNIFNGLLAIQAKHSAYFSKSQTTVIDYIRINWRKPLSVRIINSNIPPEIESDIRRLMPNVTPAILEDVNGSPRPK